MTDQLVKAQDTGVITGPVLEATVGQAPSKITNIPRLPALIGLRGVAALTVVISHVFNTDPEFVRPGFGSVAWWCPRMS